MKIHFKTYEYYRILIITTYTKNNIFSHNFENVNLRKKHQVSA